mmetsp:Transcript_18243/g.27249  ORF Transcript_18243/g.27249 Transcript_18243/m.27249 type:complete len:400 (-) Transcript_18243:411-1610(-)
MGKGGDSSENKEEIVGSFGPSLGTRVESIHSCVHILADGHLCIGSESIGFRSIDLGNERTIVFALVDISSVDEIDSSDLCIKTRSGEDFIFSSFENRDDVVTALKEANKKALSTFSADGDKAPKQERKMLRRSISFPAISSRHLLEQGDGIDDSFDELLESMADMTLGIEQQKEVYAAEQRDEANTSQSKRTIQGGRRYSVEFFSRVLKSRAPKEIENAWAKLNIDKNVLCPDILIEGVEIPYSIDDFYETFLGNEAKYPREKFMAEFQQAENIESTKWHDTGDGFTLGRVYDYYNPNPAPMGPPMAQAKTEYTLQRYNKCGIQICCTTMVSGVPMSDCFVIENRILLEQTTDDAITIKVDCGLRFVKRTMFQKLIQVTSKGGIKKTWLDYIEWIKSCS